MNTALEYSTRVVQEGGRRCKKSTLNDLVHMTPLRIPLMNPPTHSLAVTVTINAKTTVHCSPGSSMMKAHHPSTLQLLSADTYIEKNIDNLRGFLGWLALPLLPTALIKGHSLCLSLF
jgi:hypothetical protein